MFKKTLLLVITLLAVFTTSSYAAASVSDISGHWAEGTIQQWLDLDKAQGYEDGSFYPDKTVTRAEFVRLVNNGFALPVNPGSSSSPFTDVLPSDWFYKDVLQAYENQTVNGFSDSIFLPGNKVTRQEAAKIIANIIQPDGAPLTTVAYTDKNDIAAWVLDEVAFLSNHSVILGYPDSSFKPRRDLTRAEALVLIDKAVNMANKLYGTVTVNNVASAGISIKLNDKSSRQASYTTLSEGSSSYSVVVTPGSYVAVAETDKAYAAVPIEISKNKLNVLDLNLIPKVLVKGTLVNQFGVLQSNTKVVLDNGFSTFDLTSSAGGAYSLYLPAGYEYSVYYQNKQESVKFPVMGNDPALGNLTIRMTTPASTGSPDTTAPVTTYTTKALSNGSFIDRLEITLSATDYSSGVNTTQYRINGGSWISYTSPFIVDAATTEKVEYYSTDNAGNAEAIHIMDFNKGTVSFKLSTQRGF